MRSLTKSLQWLLPVSLWGIAVIAEMWVLLRLADRLGGHPAWEIPYTVWSAVALAVAWLTLIFIADWTKRANAGAWILLVYLALWIALLVWPVSLLLYLWFRDKSGPDTPQEQTS